MKKLMMLGVAMVAAASVAACSGDYSLTTQEKATADQGALLFANAARGVFLQCSGKDSRPTDDYVTCTVQLPGSARSSELQLTEVACAYRGAPGCKMKR